MKKEFIKKKKDWKTKSYSLNTSFTAGIKKQEEMRVIKNDPQRVFLRSK